MLRVVAVRWGQSNPPVVKFRFTWKNDDGKENTTTGHS